jgi:hypothetical protein
MYNPDNFLEDTNQLTQNMDEDKRSQYLFGKSHKKCYSFFNDIMDLEIKYKNSSQKLLN